MPAAVQAVSGETTLARPVVVEWLLPEKMAAADSIRITAALPDGSVEPLIWLPQDDDRHEHPFLFLFRKPLALPAGTVIRGIPAHATVALLGP